MTIADRTDRLHGSLHEILADCVAGGYAAGAVALVGRGDGAHVITVGQQTLAAAEPMQRDTIFRISSMTKPVTAIAALMLVDDGAFRLDEPVDRFLPELARPRVLKRIDGRLDDTVPANRPITIEDLLVFRMGLGLIMAPPASTPIQRAIADAGLVGFGPPDPASPLDPDEWMRRLGALPLMAQPGEQWLYTTGSNVLGVLIARASGLSLPEFLERRIFAPLGMHDTGFHVPAGKRHRLAAAYRPSAEGCILYDDPATSAWNDLPAFPAGDSGLVSTVDDFFAFSRFLSRRGRIGARQLVSEAAIAAMTRDHLTPAQREGARPFLDGHGWGYGLAVALHGNPSGGVPEGAFGWDGGLGTSWTVDPHTDTTSILMTQTMFGSPHSPAVHTDFRRALFTAAD